MRYAIEKKDTKIEMRGKSLQDWREGSNITEIEI